MRSHKYPEISVLINKAGKVFVYTHSETAGAVERLGMVNHNSIADKYAIVMLLE